jgi:purine-cytosine permease-like protein
MQLSYTLSLADFKAAFQFHRRQAFLRRISAYLWPSAAAICFVTAFSFDVNSSQFSGFFSIGSGLLVIAIGLPISQIYNVRKCYQQHYPSRRTEQVTTTEINDEYILSLIPGVSETKYFWVGIVAFAQNEKATLFYVRKNTFLFIPTRTMSPSQRMELNELVARNLLRKQK